MRWIVGSLPFSSLLLVPLFLGRASAAETAEAPDAYEYAPARTGFQLGIRTSVQVPSGGLGGGASFSDLLGPRVHMAFDIGSRLNPYFFFGGYVGVSYGLSAGAAYGDTCSATDAYGDTVSCTAESLDGGAVAIVTFLPNAMVDPWMGLTVGYELQGMNYAGATGMFSGVSPSVLAGFDFRIRNGDHKGIMSVGPYGGVTVQRYLTGDAGGTTVDTSTEPFHTWIHLGVRVTFPG
jgi:hypothetical protein